MADQYSQANELFQKGLGVAVNFEDEQKKQAIAAAKLKYDRLSEDADFHLKIAGDKSFSPEARTQSWNIVQATNKAKNPNYKPMFVDKWDPTTAAALDDIGVMQQKVTKGEFTSKQLAQYSIQRIQQVMTDPKATQAEREGAQQMMKSIQDNFAVTPRTVTQGRSIVEGNQDKMGNFAPVMVGGQPAVAPNVPAQTMDFTQGTKRLDEFQQKFNEDTVVKGMRQALSDTTDTLKLVKSDLKGVVGFIQTKVAKSAGEQRISDQDIPRFSGSTAIADKAARAFKAATDGKLSDADASDYSALLEVYQKSMRSKLDGLLDSQVDATFPGVKPEERQIIRKRIGGMTGAEINPKGAIKVKSFKKVSD